MNRSSLITIMVLIVLAVGFGCGGDEHSAEVKATDLLPPQMVSAALERTSDIRTFTGDSLWEYINGGAEIYHSFHFEDVITADYKAGEVELVVDLYRFESADMAYGLYATLRPDDPTLISYGVEGYATGSSLEFVKGSYLVRLIAYEASEAVTAALDMAAKDLAARVPGRTTPPEAFALFPFENIIPGSLRLVGEAYLGQSFLDNVYTANFSRDTDTITLFLTEDASGDKFRQWLQQAGPKARHQGAELGLPFDENYGLFVSHSYYGDIVAGLKNGKLVGVIDYRQADKSFVSDWLSTLP